MPADLKSVKGGKGERELKFIVIECEDAQAASVMLAQICDEHETGWPFLAYDDGFGHLVQVKDAL